MTRFGLTASVDVPGFSNPKFYLARFARRGMNFGGRKEFFGVNAGAIGVADARLIACRLQRKFPREAIFIDRGNKP
jgi:hypothetical protein